MAGSQYSLYLGATLIGLNFGGNFALFPVATADTVGKKHVAQNYGFIFLPYGIGGSFSGRCWAESWETEAISPWRSRSAACSV